MSLSPVECFHCGLPALDHCGGDINGQRYEFCCLGCRAVTEMIFSGGLDNFYAYRDQHSNRVELSSKKFTAFDLPDVQSDFVYSVSENILRIDLSLSGITCAACAWLIENHIKKIPGVSSIHVNVANHTARVLWDKNQLLLSDLLTEFLNIGYQAYPANESNLISQRKKESHTALQRLGVAGLGMMQVGMVAIALHAGALQGMNTDWQHYLRWISLIFAIPIICYSAQPFFMNAYRSLKLKHLTMDVPVALALLLAFFASCIATLKNTGDVYFDSVAMFTFFLLFGRYLEMRSRHSRYAEAWRLSQILPLSVERAANDEKHEIVPLTSIQVNDKIFVGAGDFIPCDGTLVDDFAYVDESLLTGESLLKKKYAGDEFYAGSLNGDVGVTLIVSAVGKDTQMAAVQELTELAQQQKPKLQGLIDKVSGYFVAAVLIISCVTGIGWWLVSPENAFWIVLSILVVTCPCALSLATPAALTFATVSMRKIGLLITAPHVLEGLKEINHIVFDKTGTLTQGKLSVSRVVTLSDKTEKEALALIASLEQYFNHPIARAFSIYRHDSPVEHAKNYPGMGVEGVIHNICYRFGLAEFSCELLRNSNANDFLYPSAGSWQLLVNEDEPIAWVLLQDSPREGLHHTLQALQKNNMKISLLSGDRVENVTQFSQGIEFYAVIGGASPGEKLNQMHEWRERGDKILFVGDGLNDLPILSGADISIAMGDATHLARTKADVVLLNSHLMSLVDMFHIAMVANNRIKQNMLWAIGYNIIALPAAIMGLIPPYLAAIGMSVSSLVVVFNSLRK